MKELKMGDVVEVLNNDGCWEDGIFITYGKYPYSIICVSQHNIKLFKEGEGFKTLLWKDSEWRFPIKSGNNMADCGGVSKMENELKMGDEVEILCLGMWEKRIFVKHGNNKGIVCVTDSDESGFKDGKGFNTIHWNAKEWRIPPKPDYVPFDLAEGVKQIGKAVKVKDRNIFRQIGSVEMDSIYGVGFGFGGDLWDIDTKNLFENYTFLDGSPCGMLKKKGVI